MVDTYNILRKLIYISGQAGAHTDLVDTGIPISNAHEASLVTISVITTSGPGKLKVPSYVISGGTLSVNVQNTDGVPGNTATGKIEVLLRHTILNSMDTAVSGPLVINALGD